MKKLSTLGIMLLVLVAFSAVCFAGSQDFTLVNQTGHDIHYVYVSPHSSNDWGSDIMGKDALPNGTAVNISFSPGDKSAIWDLRVDYADGASEVWENFDLNTISQITVLPGGQASYE